ncbi:hypothetical protein ZYGR_0BA00190 [Zygosaccharomyces rouxii]|uniref:rRNA adenine N(6)-methyltransferase n=1 Tax=Zygosaccharomyces rouxii TaxID=4956 RepID=A0A1Q3AKQ9_ZYGRO|nr:hypothetical protein ZYGR_0BA00190 [Zygosaccharomyces rouxii]
MSLPVRNYAQLSKIKHFYGSKFLLNEKIHDRILDKLKIEKTFKNSREMKVLDLYTGPGQHSAIFYNRYKPKQYGVMEARPDFQKILKEQYEHSPIQIFAKDPYEWTSYTDLINSEKAFVPEKQPHESLNNKFMVIANLTNSAHEGLLMQWFNCIGNTNWLQRFGHVKMLLWVPISSATKLLATPGMHMRSKCSIVREAFTDTNLVAISDGSEKKQFDRTVWECSDPLVFQNEDTYPQRGNGIALLEVNPKKHITDLDNWDYVTKHLLILRKTRLKDAVESLGHGAKDYFSQKVEDPTFLNKYPVDLTNDDFNYLANLFNMWPFKPDIYMDFIDIYQEEGMM